MAYIDILLLITTFISEPIILFSQGNVIIYGVGIVNYLPEPSRGIAFSLLACWAFAQAVGIYALPNQFIYRYFALCKDKPLSPSIYSWMLSISVVFALISITIEWASQFHPGVDLQLARSIFFPNSSQNDRITIILFAERVNTFISTFFILINI